MIYQSIFNFRTNHFLRLIHWLKSYCWADPCPHSANESDTNYLFWEIDINFMLKLNHTFNFAKCWTNQLLGLMKCINCFQLLTSFMQVISGSRASMTPTILKVKNGSISPTIWTFVSQNFAKTSSYLRKWTCCFRQTSKFPKSEDDFSKLSWPISLSGATPHCISLRASLSQCKPVWVSIGRDGVTSSPSKSGS